MSDNLSRQLQNFAVGVPIVFIGTVVFAGGLENAAMVLLASVVCTFGLGLLFWLPLCWFVGWLVMSILR